MLNSAALARNWSVKADPFYAVHARSGYSLDQVTKLSPVEAVTAVLGDALAAKCILGKQIDAATKVQGVLLAAWCYMHLRQRQATLSFPIAIGESFIFPQPSRRKSLRLAGLDLLMQVGDLTHDYKVNNAGWSAYYALVGKGEAADTALKLLASKYQLNYSTVKQAILARATAGVTDVKVLTYLSAQEMIVNEFGCTDNLVFVNHNWLKSFDFLATQQDVAVVLDWLSGALHRPMGDQLVTVHARGEDFSVFLDGQEFLITAREGVFQTARNRRFNNMLLVNNLAGYSKEHRVLAEDLSLVNSYGTFLYGLLNLGAKYLVKPVPELAQLVNKVLVAGNELPLSSDDEVGAGDADRVFYERYVTQERLVSDTVPFAFSRYLLNGEMKLKATYGNSVSLLPQQAQAVLGEMGEAEGVIEKLDLPNKSMVDRAALLGFNLVRMPRGKFIDGRKVCIQAKHIDESLRAEFVLQQVNNQGGLETVRKAHKLEGTDAQVLEQLGNHMIIGQSSKLNKLVKRCAMDSAVVAELVGGETRGFKRYGQKDESVNNWLVESVISPHAIWPAGMAAYWGEHPTLVVKHTETLQPTVPAVAELKSAVKPEYDGATVSYEFGWWVAKYAQPLPVGAGALVARVPFQLDGLSYERSIRTEIPEARLCEIHWRYGNSNGNTKALEVKVLTETLEHEVKGRNGIKCMLGRYTPDCIHHDLNADLNARAVFFTDTNKWLDLLNQCLDVAACTAVKNQDATGLKLIAEANALLGVEDSVLVYSPVLAAMGAYQPLLDWFEDFGRAVWFKWPDPTGEWTGILRQLYTQHDAECEAKRTEAVEGWTRLTAADLPGVVPNGAERVLMVADGNVGEAKTNVLVFYVLDGVDHFVQRAFSYVGTGDAPVWQPVKAELSSIASSVSVTPLMAGVARAIETKDPEFAMRLVQDGFKGVHKAAALYAMSKAQTLAVGGVELPMVMVGSAEAKALLETEALLEIVNNPDNDAELLTLLTPHFRDVVLNVCAGVNGHFTLWLPAVLAQDSASGFSSAGSMSGLMTDLLVMAIRGVDSTSELFMKLAVRAKGALNKLAQSKGLAKEPAFGRMGVGCKAKGLPGIPFCEVWVRESAAKHSIYKMMQKVFGTKAVDGRKVIFNRAPLTTPTVMQVRVISDGSSFSDLIEAHSCYVSPLGQYLNRGDLDGDPVGLYDAEDSALELSTVADIKASFIAATGSDQLNPGHSYWGDHFNVPSAQAIAKKRALGLKNYSLDVCDENLFSSQTRKSLPAMLEGSTQAFTESVGWAHLIFLTTDLYTSVSKLPLQQVYEKYEAPAFTQNVGITLMSAENYEVPLGGLDWGAYNVFYKTLIPAAQGCDVFSPAYIEGEFKRDLEQAGMNKACAKDIYAAAVAVGRCQAIEKGELKELGRTVLDRQNPAGIVELVAQISFLVSKGQFEPKPKSKHLEMVNVFTEWVTQFDPERVLVNQSVVLSALYEYASTMVVAYSAQVPSVEACYF